MTIIASKSLLRTFPTIEYCFCVDKPLRFIIVHCIWETSSSGLAPSMAEMSMSAPGLNITSANSIICSE